MTTETIKNLLQEAHQADQSGDLEAAKRALLKIIKLDPDHAETLSLLGQTAHREQQFTNAITYYQQALKHAQKNPWIYFDLGLSQEKTGQMLAAGNSYLKAWHIAPQNAQFCLYAGAAFFAEGNEQQALQVWSLGADQDPMVRAAHQHPQADLITKEKSLLADTQLRKHLSAQHTKSLNQEGAPPRLKSSLWPQTHISRFNYRHPAQKPYVFYAPDLPATPVFTNPVSNWVDELQGATDDVRKEYLAFMRTKEAAPSPYIDENAMMDQSYDHLKHHDTWTAVHLYKGGKAQACLEHFPATQKALKNAPLVHFHGQPMEVFFSILKPGIHIPPHFGLANTRVTAHLPLIIPHENCRIRVSDITHHWQEGQLFMFDDSFDHEAWNDSAQTRVVLIFEAWRPDLSENEIKAIQTSFEDRSDWLLARRMPKVNLD